MFSLSGILSSIGLPFIDKIIDKGAGIWESYLKKEISKEELRTRLLETILGAAKEIEVTHANVLAQTYASFTALAKESRLIQLLLVWVVGSQLFVLLWHQWAIPMIVIGVRWYIADDHWNYPSSGETVTWAYAIVGGLCGLAPVILRAGPGAGNIYERLKSIVK